MAMVAYLVLGALAFATLSDFRIRALTLLILGMFAFKSWVRRKDVLHPDVEGESEPDALAESRRPTADGRFEPM
jgi:hypothetical protein